MRTLKIKTSLVKPADSLSDAELGRLFRGMLQYASSGAEPTLSGTERILWAEIREDIDSQLYAFKKMCERNHKNITARYDSLRLATTGNDSLRLVEKEKEEREESGEREEQKAKRPPQTPPVKERQEEKEGKEGKAEKEHTARARGFVPPTLDEVRAYCRERNSPVDPYQFWEYFNTGEWIDSKGQPVRNWKQKLLTWERMGLGRGERAGHAPQGAGKVFDIRYDVSDDE